jgi:orotidine-5'-phosphate decarboxylase
MENSLFCCGLDPDVSKMPVENGLDDNKRTEKFLRTIIDMTSSHVCAYKLQKAFFDKLSNGHEVLKNTISYIHSKNEKNPAIVDCKIGDIDNTMLAYLDNLFGELKADGIVVNPYMGDDVMKPLSQYPDKAIVVLAKTSNPNGSIIQDVKLENGSTLWQYVLNLITDRWNTAGNMIPVISSTVDINLADTRKIIPDNMPILLAGVGAQGGSYSEISKLLNSKKSGVFVNSSRGVIYAKTTGDQKWQDAVEQASINLRNALNDERSK